ncbi:MAG: CARDB domain-containing protein, partial [Bacteroidota bacterium]|nr:CARDB domain-containing protein [Bacteroidota bacterium]
VIHALSVDVTASETTICTGSATQLFSNVGYGYGNYSYQWTSVPAGYSSGLPNPIVTPTVNTRYFLIVSDGTNIAEDSIDIEIFANPPPSAVLGLLPADAEINLTKPFTFSWLPSLFATEYDIYLWKSSDPVPVLPWRSTSQITYTYNYDLDFGTNYSWKVVAKNVCFETSSTVQTFTTRFLPDLIVNDVQVPTSAYSGQNFTVSWEIKNQGSGSTMSQQWYDRAYLSTDTTLEINVDLNLGYVSNLSFLDVNQSYIQSESFTLPDGISGNYYIFIVTDYSSHLLEEDEGNNTGRNTSPLLVTLTPPPDLQVSSIITPNNTFSGLPINVTWTVKNFGSGATTTSYWHDMVYLTTDEVFDAGNASMLGSFYHSGALQTDSTYTTTESFTIPANVFGTYYVFIYTDFYNQVYEHATENNNISGSDSITVFLTPPPDLQVTSLSHVASASNKESVALTWTVQNLGGSATTDYFHDKIWLADNPNDDLSNATYLGVIYHPSGMNPGEIHTETHSYTIPSVTGPHYFYVVADYQNYVFEHLNEDNNTTHSSTPIQVNNPDLIVTKVLVPASDATGQPVPISWTVKNDGVGDVIYSSSWQDRLYISYIDEFYNDSVIVLNTYTSGTSLAAGDSITHTKNIVLPEFVPGPYYIFVYTDYNNNVFEGVAENNNITHSAGTIEIIRPDLIVSSIISPATGSSGQLINLDWVVKNNGGGTLFMDNWIDRVMFS